MIKVKRKVAFQGEAHKRRDAARVARVKLAQSGRIPRIAKLVALDRLLALDILQTI